MVGKKILNFLWMFSYRPISQNWASAHSEPKHNQPLTRLYWCVWACVRLSNLPISPRDTAVSSQSSLLVRWAQEWAVSRLCPRRPVFWGQARRATLTPHRTKPLWSRGAVMLIQPSSGTETQLVCFVDLFRMCCMLYLPLVINKHRCECKYWDIEGKAHNKNEKSYCFYIILSLMLL